MAKVHCKTWTRQNLEKIVLEWYHSSCLAQIHLVIDRYSGMPALHIEAENLSACYAFAWECNLG